MQGEPRRCLGATVIALAALAAAGCGSSARHESKPAPRAQSHATLASGKALPARCVTGKTRAKATVTFVANGRAWALEPRSGRLTCLFAVHRAGPFAWGPRGDRALLARLEVKSLGAGPRRPAGSVDPPAESWGRPIGKSIVFVGRNGHALLKAHPAGGGFLDVTPIRGAEYKQVVYHPSGLAFAFVLKRGGHESIWLSSNIGTHPEKLVHGLFHTGFDAIAFGDAGSTLYFAARHKDDHVDIHSLPLVGATSAPVVWRGKPGERVTDLLPGWPGVAFTVGRSCASRRAVVWTAAHAGGAELLRGVRPSRAVGWLDNLHVLVAAGGCGRALDLYFVDSSSLKARPLVKNVDAASVRVPEPLPPPPLPPREKGARSSFA